jgi:uncharacterized membrane protein
VSGEGWNRRAALIVARASFASIALWIALATWLHATGPAWLYRVVDLPFAFLCHRIPERVISVMGTPMPLCSRCLGLWGGLSISAAIAWPAIDPKALRWALPLAGLVMLVDVVTQDLGLHPIWHPTRLLTGLLVSVPMGGAIGALITREMSPRA